MKLLSNNLLIRRVPTTQVGAIHMPPSMLDDMNNGTIHMHKLLGKGPGRLTRKGVLIPFEGEVGDNLIVWGGVTTPIEGTDEFILKDPENSVLAVIPLQR